MINVLPDCFFAYQRDCIEIRQCLRFFLALTAPSRKRAKRSKLSRRRVLSSSVATLLHVFLFASCAPAVQIFIPTMRALDRRQLIVEIRCRFVVGCRGRDRDDSSARSVLAQPTYVDLIRHHLLRCLDTNVSQRRGRNRSVRWSTPAFCRTFDRHCRLFPDAICESLPRPR